MNRLFVLTLALVAIIVARAETIYVADQADFDALNASIAKAVSRGEKDINIQMEPQTYFFKENHLSIIHRQWGGVSIAIHGNGATVIAQGRELVGGQQYNGSFSHAYGYVSEQEGDVPLWGDLQQAAGNIDVVNEQTKLCRLRHPYIPKMSREQCKDVYVQVTQWFKSVVYKVDYTERGMAYFTANDLAYNSSYKCQSVNLDYGFGKQTPRFRMCNMPKMGGNLVSIASGRVQLPRGVDKVYECQTTRFLNLSYTTLSQFEIEGVNFLGNAGSDQYLIYIRSNEADRINIATCSFRGMRSGIVQVMSTPNVSITTNQFADCYSHGIVVNGSNRTHILDNDFQRMGLAIQNTFCIRVDGMDYLVSGNELQDFGYGGISVGVWWAREKKGQCAGTVEYNHLYYTPQYMTNILAHSLMDSGAIYLYTQNDRADIRYNYIHDYTGAYENRGVFADDGAYGFSLYGNVIVNTPNSYSIDSRRVINIETNPKSFAKSVNRNISIYDNVIDGAIRFEARDKNANCQLGDNVLLTNNNRQPAHRLQDLSRQASFTTASFTRNQQKLHLASPAMSRIARFSSYQNMKRWLE